MASAFTSVPTGFYASNDLLNRLPADVLATLASDLTTRPTKVQVDNYELPDGFSPNVSCTYVPSFFFLFFLLLYIIYYTMGVHQHSNYAAASTACR
jgi:hypothetical protein